MLTGQWNPDISCILNSFRASNEILISKFLSFFSTIKQMATLLLLHCKQQIIKWYYLRKLFKMSKSQKPLVWFSKYKFFSYKKTQLKSYLIGTNFHTNTSAKFAMIIHRNLSTFRQTISSHLGDPFLTSLFCIAV